MGSLYWALGEREGKLRRGEVAKGEGIPFKFSPRALIYTQVRVNEIEYIHRIITPLSFWSMPATKLQFIH